MAGGGQTQTHLQVYAALVRYGRNLQAAIEQPRWVHGVEQPGEGETLRLERCFPAETVAELRAKGHHVQLVEAYDSVMGHAQGITFDHANGVLGGGAGPRAQRAALRWESG